MLQGVWQRHKSKKSNKMNTKGFTMSELLIVVSILIILMAIIAVSLVALHRSLRQKELDAKAETIFMAAQNQLSKMRASGHEKDYIMDENSPQRLYEISDMVYERDDGVYYTAKGLRPADKIIYVDNTADVKSNLDDELRDHYWVIEFDNSGNVYAVFYSEKRNILPGSEEEYDYKAHYSTFNEGGEEGHGLRDYKTRKADGALIGYYGGDLRNAAKEPYTLDPTIMITNAERLTAYIECCVPNELDSPHYLTFKLKWKEKGTDKEVEQTLRVDLTSTSGIDQKYFEQIKTEQVVKNTNGIKKVYQKYAVRMILDDLSSTDKRFRNLYPQFTPGNDISLELSVSSANTLARGATVKTENVNTLFDNGSNTTVKIGANTIDNTGTALIACGRHLQNLDDSSGVGSFITKAVQTNDIKFGINQVYEDNLDKLSKQDIEERYWLQRYNSDPTKGYFNGVTDRFGTSVANFKPIENDNLTSYDGKDSRTKSIDGKEEQHRITGLTVSARGDAGLFGACASEKTLSLNNIILTGSKVTGTGLNGNAAALLGSTEGTVTIDNCQVYLERSDINGKNDKDIWIESNGDAGGLVGNVDSSVTIKNSFASSVIKGDDNAGGLIGKRNGGTVNIEKSYADSYLTGQNTGGLAVGNVHNISDCYAAGFQTASAASGETSAAGLINGKITNIAKNSYTVCSLEGNNDNTFTSYATAKEVEDNADSLYYLSAGNKGSDKDIGNAIGSTSSSELAESLGGAFDADTNNESHPYNLRRNNLNIYPYPRLKISEHYGDWIDEFVPGSLVYYEKYSANSYGIDRIDTLIDSKTVIGDGYGILYRARSTIPSDLSIDVRINGGEWNPVQEAVSVSSGKYTLFPLRYEDVNASHPAGKGFYSKIEVRTRAGTATPEIKEFYFNPHYAKTEITPATGSDTTPQLHADSTVYIRSPRHLNHLSYDYDEQGNDYKYHKLIEELMKSDSDTAVTFVQETNLDYSKYDWDYADKGRVSEQLPIGVSEEHPFRSNYNGGLHEINNVSFVTPSDRELGFVGLFGCVDTKKRIESTIVASVYTAGSNKFVSMKRSKRLSDNETLYMGVLAGYNKGTINNCAAAGYYLAGDFSINAYSNSRAVIGGLVGGNEGVISDSQSDLPQIQAAATYADLLVGGFAGLNRAGGIIRRCYDLTYIEATVSDSKTSVAGFAGQNEGQITSSYCATAFSVNGDPTASHGFAPKGGSVGSDCYYLDMGTFRFVKKLHTYASEESRTSGTPVTYRQLRRLWSSQRANRSYYHNNTSNKDNNYPFRAVIKDKSNRLRHYGDWVEEPVMGSLGVFYWENETGGSNSGYHLTYIGTIENEMEDYGTTLCTAHDDGGVISEYGYGYYVQKGYEGNITAEGINGIEISGSNAVNQEAQRNLGIQMPGYTFYPFTTRDKEETGKDYICLDKEGMPDTTEAAILRTGHIKLRYNNQDYVYEINPFFANAMSCVSLPGKTSVPSIKVTATDGTVSDYSKVSGFADNNYEIRSIGQLSYINWNYENRNTKTLVKQTNSNKDNRKEFPYLQYAGETNNQKRADVEKNRPPQIWKQSHDLREMSDETAESGRASEFTPIAGNGNSSAPKDFTYYLRAWFGGTYNGQSYKIQDLNIVSDCYTVALFGTTVGANISNMIMYGNGETRVERKTDLVDGEINTRYGAYDIGGLIGLAYDYSDSNNTISNCAIADYRIVDNSHNQHGKGYASIGGLIGVSQVNLTQCSAVTNIELRYTSPTGLPADNTYSEFGNMLRVGGLAGAALHNVRDCYTGGSVKVAGDTLETTYEGKDYGDTLNEKPSGFNPNKTPQQNRLNRARAMHIFIGGIAGCSYQRSIINFGNKAGATDGSVYLDNCYTYMDLPGIKGNIRSVSVLIGAGDRFNMGTKLYVNNCYYLDRVYDGITYGYSDENPQEYYFDTTKQKQGATRPYVLTAADVKNIKLGNLEPLIYVVHGQGPGGGIVPEEAQQTRKVFDELGNRRSDESTAQSGDMADSLNKDGSSLWGWVTIKDAGGGAVDGKYSFSSDPAQKGKNYPFPTIVRQPDLVFHDPAGVNVHYGKWPSNGSYWEKARDEMDLFQEEMVADGDGKKYAEKVFNLYYKTTEEPPDEIDPESFTVSNDKVVIRKAEKKETVSTNLYRYEVTVRAIDTGSVVLTYEEAELNLTITAQLKLSFDPEKLMLVKNDPVGFDLFAKAAKAKSGTEPAEYEDYSTAAADYIDWTVEPVDVSTQKISVTPRTGGRVNQWEVTSLLDPGQYELKATFTYHYPKKKPATPVPGDETKYKTYTETVFIPVHMLGYVGMSYDDYHVGHAREKSANILPGTINSDYPEGSDADTAEPYDPAKKRPGVFLYGTLGDKDLGDFTVLDIKVIEHDGEEKEIIKDGDPVPGSEYDVTYGSVVDGSKMQFKPIYIRHRNGDSYDEHEVNKVIVVAKDPNTDTRYRFKVPEDGEKVKMPKYMITYDPGDGEGFWYPDGTSGNTFALRENQDTFTRSGYDFGGWDSGSDHYADGGVINDISGDIALIAHWNAHKYKVEFDANGGKGEMGSQSFTYDADPVALTENEFIHDDGLKFAGWNTERDGSGIAYADKEKVKNLTSEKDGTVKLYAQWVDEPFEVNLMIDGDMQYSVAISSDDQDSIDTSGVTTPEGFTVVGWYISDDDSARQILDEEGKIIDSARNIQGYTKDGHFDLKKDVTIYAKLIGRIYRKVDELNTDADNGTYLIMSDVLSSSGDTDTRNAFGYSGEPVHGTEKDLKTKNGFSKQDVFLSKVSGEDMYLVDENVTDVQQWLLEYCEDRPGGYYTISSLHVINRANDLGLDMDTVCRYLRQHGSNDGDAPYLQRDLIWPAEHATNNRLAWKYGIKTVGETDVDHILESLWSTADSNGRRILRYNNKWETKQYTAGDAAGIATMKSYLFRQEAVFYTD